MKKFQVIDSNGTKIFISATTVDYINFPEVLLLNEQRQVVAILNAPVSVVEDWSLLPGPAMHFPAGMEFVAGEVMEFVPPKQPLLTAALIACVCAATVSVLVQLTQFFGVVAV